MGKPTSANLLKGTRGNDALTVSLRTDQPWTVDGGAGNDVLVGGSGADTLLGGNGNDVIFGSLEDAKLDGGLGYDTLDLSGVDIAIRYLALSGGQLTAWPDATPATYTIASGFERVIGGSAADWLIGGSGAETLIGGGGNDHLDGGWGNDVLEGGAGADYFEFSNSSGGADQVTDFAFGTDHLFFYAVPQPDISQIYVSGSDLVVPWANGSVTLTGLGWVAPNAYGDLFTLTNGDIFVI